MQQPGATLIVRYVIIVELYALLADLIFVTAFVRPAHVGGALPVRHVHSHMAYATVRAILSNEERWL